MSICRGFGSDNHSGAHPEVLAALAAANAGHCSAYGDDPWTARGNAAIRSHLGQDCDVAFVFNGTGANCVSFAAVCRPWESVICAETAHVNTDECAAPEKIAGVKLVPVATADGKLTPDAVRPHLVGFGFEHHAQPRVISISNVSELGTVYTAEEVRALADLAHEHSMLLHVDGARLANAAVSLGCSLAAITVEAGVDLLSFGGTKNGLAFGEAVVVFGDARVEHLAYVRKQSGQLASKMRYVAAQFAELLETDLWRTSATGANEMARRLADGAVARGIELAYAVDANELFAWLPSSKALELAERFRFYVWDESPDARDRLLVRWVTSWDTSAGDVDGLLAALDEPAA